MPINPNIALQVQPVQMENPLNMMAKYAAMQQAQQDQQMNALKMQEYQRGVEEQNQLRSYLAGGMQGGESRLLGYGTAGRGAYEALLKGRRETREAESAEATRRKTDIEAKLKVAELARERFNFIATNPADDVVASVFAGMVEDGLLKPNEAQAISGGLLKLAPQARQQELLKMSAKVEAQAAPYLKAIEEQLTFPYKSPTTMNLGTGVEGVQQPAVLQPKLGADGRPGFDVQQVGPVKKAYPPQPLQVPAPVLTQIIDPKNPNQMITVNARTNEVVGVSGKEPAAATREAKLEKGRAGVTDVVDQLESAYTQLHDLGGISSTKKGTLANLAASTAASSVGQFVGRAAGTEEQRLRDIINSSRMQLLNAIKEATGMSAQQMNSNVELQNWLKAVSDPSQSYETAMTILGNIRDRYIHGVKSPRESSGQIRGGSSEVDALVQKYGKP